MPKKGQVTYNPFFQSGQEEDWYDKLAEFEGLSGRKPISRRTVDYHASMINYLEKRSFFHSYKEMPRLKPSPNSVRDLQPLPFCEKNNPSHAYCTKYVSTSINKHKCAINCLNWSPDGRRLVTGNAMGQFTLWNGLKFNFDTILQAHDAPIR